ncbi:SPFH domain-containing protein [Nonomuraea sp. NPDC048892]|uniref:SPFH domain-containing protein n=1 Tax=Nonomuraea sp. NPDC048892 TaxID=3154624 RepID=UPI0033EE83A4
MKRTLPGVLLAAAALTGCSVTNVEPDEGGIVYDAGMFSSTTFQECLKPSTRDVSGPGDEGYRYPNGQRTYDFTGRAESEGKPITSVSKDGQIMTMIGGLTFYFSAADCKKLQAFHENIGKKYAAYEADGWTRMLQFYIGNSVERAMDEATLKYNWRELYSDPAKKALWEQDMSKLTNQYVSSLTQGEYFERLQFIIRQPEPPKSIVDAQTETQAAQERQKAQEAENTRALTELKSLEKLAKVLGPQGAILYKAIQDGKVSIVPVPTGSAVNVTPKQ